MKLYSKSQLIIISSICALAAVAVTLFTTLSISKKADERRAPQVSESTQNTETKINVASDFSDDDLVNFQTNDANLKQISTYTAEDGYTQEEIQNITVYEKCSDAVVNISTQVIQYNWFFEAYPTDGGTGSGSIIDKRGYVVTNRHVIKDAYKIYISLADGTQYEGKLVGQDSQTDIAVVKFEPPENIELTTIPFADSANLKIGQKVIAIGNPFGFDRTMTTGIISSLGRPIQSNNTILQDMIQTDTAINPGNSGGPLLDTQGRMIGINTMIYSTSGSSAGVGFAMPVNTAKRIVSDLMRYGKVKRGSLNITAVPVTQSLARYANLSTSTGILISEVTRGSNAEKAGLQGGTEAVRYSRSSATFYIGGDIITAINGISVSSVADYNSALEKTKPGDEATITIIRGKKTLDVVVVLEERN
ncbi:MAG: trypsin-like peptidase domain-containing protein [Treponemataceae bacterium]|nr:trypsin-like peptidase domain-containing protein [Treponemataceae bacterium]